MKDFNKTVRLGTTNTYGGRGMSIFCKIQYQDGKLSISGVEGPLASGNCLGSCGQIDMSLEPKDFNTFAPGWSRGKVRQFLEVWDKWHLNDMVAGSPAQTAELKKHDKDEWHTGWDSHFDWAKHVLKQADLQPDNKLQYPDKDGNMTPYSYGSKWLRVDVPVIALDFLASLPDTDKQPAWV